MADFAEGYESEDEDGFAGSDLEDVFIREDPAPGGTESKLERAISWLREELQVDESQSASGAASGVKDIPVFMGHGREDEKVPNEINKLATEFLSSIGVEVERKEYQGLGHWYSESMLRDVIEFLKRLERWKDIVSVDKSIKSDT